MTNGMIERKVESAPKIEKSEVNHAKEMNILEIDRRSTIDNVPKIMKNEASLGIKTIPPTRIVIATEAMSATKRDLMIAKDTTGSNQFS